MYKCQSSSALMLFEFFYFFLHSETPACLMGKVGQLESMVKALQEDLKKVRWIDNFCWMTLLHNRTVVSLQAVPDLNLGSNIEWINLFRTWTKSADYSPSNIATESSAKWPMFAQLRFDLCVLEPFKAVVRCHYLYSEFYTMILKYIWLN